MQKGNMRSKRKLAIFKDICVVTMYVLQANTHKEQWLQIKLISYSDRMKEVG